MDAAAGAASSPIDVEDVKRRFRSFLTNDVRGARAGAGSRDPQRGNQRTAWAPRRRPRRPRRT